MNDICTFYMHVICSLSLNNSIYALPHRFDESIEYWDFFLWPRRKGGYRRYMNIKSQYLRKRLSKNKVNKYLYTRI